MFEKKVLIVGNGDIRRVLQLIMDEFGYDVLEASNGNEALKIIRNNDELGLVVTDHKNMSVMNGMGLIYQLRRPANGMPNGIPVILLCNKLKPAEQNELRQYGKVKLLEKPFVVKDLMVAIKAIINPCLKNKRYLNRSSLQLSAT